MLCPAGHDQRGKRANPELANVFSAYGDRLPALSPHQARTVQAILSCRTAALGGRVLACDHCDHSDVTYNSCRNRNCPKCQGLDEVRWVERQQKLLLPTEYHHVVFTVSDVLHPLLLGNPREGYGLLFRAVASTLKEVGLRPSNLGARIGFTAVLHTWNQLLEHHPHLHCIVPGGGLSLDGQRWVSAKPRFLFNVDILMLVFRGKFLNLLEKAIASGEFRAADGDGLATLRRAASKKWHVYSKPPFAGPEQVLRYLGRYTHRIAISNSRLVSMKDGKLTLRWRDRRDNNQSKLKTLDAELFLRRFLLHILPPGFMRIRHYGILANSRRKEDITTCRKFLAIDVTPAEPDEGDHEESWQELLLRVTGKDVTLCPECGVGHLHVLETIAEPRRRARSPPSSRTP